jgi:hypothetical protein
VHRQGKDRSWIPPFEELAHRSSRNRATGIDSQVNEGKFFTIQLSSTATMAKKWWKKRYALSLQGMQGKMPAGCEPLSRIAKAHSPFWEKGFLFCPSAWGHWLS